MYRYSTEAAGLRDDAAAAPGGRSRNLWAAPASSRAAMMTAGQLLREARWRSGMTQREIAARMFITYPAIHMAEKRGDGITVRRVRAQLAAMGYDLHLMVTRRPE